MAKTSKKKKTADSEQDQPQTSGKPATTRRNGSTKKSRTKKSSSGETAQNKPRRSKAAKGSSKGRRILTWLRFILICLAVVAALLIYLFDLSRVSSNAMMPTLAQGDLVLSFAPGFVSLELKPGQIALIRNDQNEAAPNFLRVIANNGETVSYNEDRLSINGIALSRVRLTNAAIARPEDEPDIWRENVQDTYYKISLPQRALAGSLNGSIQLAQAQAFLAGDNRLASYDSRQAGPYDNSQIRGRALIILESMRDDGVLGHWMKLLDL